MTHKNEDIINILVNIRNELRDSIDNKRAIIEELQEDINRLRIRIKDIDKFISINSIITAEQLYDTETFLEKKENHKLENIDFIRKIFSPDDNRILLIMFEYNGNSIRISFPNPNITQITPVCNTYLNSIIRPLMELKEHEQGMEINITHQNEEGNITKMEIKNVFSFENVEMIFNIFNKLISEQI